MRTLVGGELLPLGKEKNIIDFFHKRLQLFMVCGTPDPKNYKKLYNNVGVSFINKKAPVRRLFESMVKLYNKVPQSLIDLFIDLIVLVHYNSYT